MKLKSFYDLIKEKDELNDLPWEKDEDNDQEELDIEEVEPEAEEIDDEDIIENLLSTLRKMIKPSFEKSYVFTDEDGCINIQFVLNKEEKISRIMKVMNIIKKIESDILIQYDSEFDLWETKSGEPLVTAKFQYDEGVRSKEDALPF